MAKAGRGDTVRVHYTGKLEDGTVFDSSKDRHPLEFKVGEGKIIPGFESAVEGMEAGDTSTVDVPAEKAYGPYRDEMVMEVNKSEFPENIKPEKGQQLQVRQSDNDDQTFLVTVTDVKDESVVLDANHPLAGKKLTFDIELLEVVGEDEQQQ